MTGGARISKIPAQGIIEKLKLGFIPSAAETCCTKQGCYATFLIGRIDDIQMAHSQTYLQSMQIQPIRYVASTPLLSAACLSGGRDNNANCSDTTKAAAKCILTDFSELKIQT